MRIIHYYTMYIYIYINATRIKAHDFEAIYSRSGLVETELFEKPNRLNLSSVYISHNHQIFKSHELHIFKCITRNKLCECYQI